MTNKVLLVAIALGLWANAVSGFARQPPSEESSYLSNIDMTLTQIKHDLDMIQINTSK